MRAHPSGGAAVRSASAGSQSCRTPPDLPEGYRRWRASTLGRITEDIESGLVLAAMKEVEGRRVLDVGCGDGTYSAALVERGAQVVGADLSREMLRSACTRMGPETRDAVFVRADANLLPFADRSFDAVLGVTVLCFARDLAPPLREIHRVLMPGGRLVLGELRRWSLWALWRWVRGRFGSPTWRAARFRSARQLRASLEAAGLLVEHVRGAIYYPPWAPAARLLWRADHHLAALTTAGAAFLVLSAARPDHTATGGQD